MGIFQHVSVAQRTAQRDHPFRHGVGVSWASACDHEGEEIVDDHGAEIALDPLSPQMCREALRATPASRRAACGGSEPPGHAHAHRRRPDTAPAQLGGHHDQRRQREARDSAGPGGLRGGVDGFVREHGRVDDEPGAAPDRLGQPQRPQLRAQRFTAPVLPGQTTLAVQDGSGWSAGKTVTLCGPVTCESRRLARDGQRSLLTLAEPISLALPIGASVEAANRISYYIRRDETGAVRLMRMVDGGASTVIGDLKAAQFAYRDSEDRPTTVTAQVRRIVAVIAAAHSSAVVVRDVGLRS